VRIAILTWGTRGDVQPYAALAHELGRRGHRPVLAVNENHLAWVERMGLAAARLPFDVQALMDTAEARRWLAAGNTVAFLRWLGALERGGRAAIEDALLAATDGADAIVATFLLSHRAAVIAEARGVPFARVHGLPVAPTADYPSPFLYNGMPALPFGALRRASHTVILAVAQRGQRPELDALRARLGLRPDRRAAERVLMARRVPTLHTYSARVLPRPRDWPPHLLVTGYCPLPAALRAAIGEGAVPADLDAWLDAGPAPIFFGFGSMPVLDPDAMLALVRDACRAVGARALVAAGWSRLAAASDRDAFVVGNVNYDAVLPRCRAAVHHGGAGTTGVSLGAGVPTIVCSVFAEQPLWGARVAALGVGGTIPFQRLGRATLVPLLRRALADDVAARARALGAALRAEDGVTATADALLAALGR
jgi:UDP:flavonoid glycosyltransferase YjiC (YdhE family)